MFVVTEIDARQGVFVQSVAEVPASFEFADVHLHGKLFLVAVPGSSAEGMPEYTKICMGRNSFPTFERSHVTSVSN
jgi:hypothetical protein